MFLSSRLLPVLVVLAFSVPAPAGSGNPVADANGPVTLRFAWPSKFEARVQYHRVKQETGKPQAELSLTPRLIVSPEGKGYRVAYRRWMEGRSEDPLIRLSFEILEQITSVIDEHGALVRIEGSERVAEVADKIPGIEKVPPETRRQLATLGPRIAERDQSDLWNSLVGNWSGSELEIGKEKITETSVPIAALGVTIRYHVRQVAVRRLPCPGATSRTCVQLEMNTKPEAADLERFVKDQVAKLGFENANKLLSQLDTTAQVELTTEPETLLPHFLRIKRITGARAGNGTESVRTERVDIQEYSYTFE